jgi:TnpA family transposase
MMVEWELMNDWFLGGICFHRLSPVRVRWIYSWIVLRKLGAYPCQNALAIALRELGKLERTLFLLEYIRDVELRRRIHIGLNKGEARNALARAMFFNHAYLL